LGIVAKLGVGDETVFPILFNLFVLISSITFSISVYIYSNYENKEHILQSAADKKE
jgi:hypothetical protein